jgi:hypothetical protein
VAGAYDAGGQARPDPARVLKNRLAQALTGRGQKSDERDWHALALRHALQQIADSEADVDAYIALVSAEERDQPRMGAEIGRRLLAAGRTKEALAALERASPKPRVRKASDDEELYLAGHGGDVAWEEVYIAALDAAAQQERAQKLRWTAFGERLSAERLRAYLDKLPDFDDVEAEERAMQHALGFKSFSVALDFLYRWPDQTRAAQLVLTRASEIDGNLYYLLDPAAHAIEGKHPLAATMLRRAMIEDTLDGAKSTRYKHAARHFLECLSLAQNIEDYGAFETHEAFVTRLRAKHGRKVGFWTQASEASGSRR